MPAGVIQVIEIAAPATPPTGSVRLYAKADGFLYSKDDVGTETQLGGGGGGSEPANQIVYGTGGGIDSDADFTYNNTTGEFFVNTVDGVTGNVTVASAGDVGVFAASTSTAASDGGDVNVRAGDGNTTGFGGSILVVAGTGGDTGNGGNVALYGGVGGATSGSGGFASLRGGDATTDGGGGVANVIAGNGAGTDASAGGIYLYTGTPTGTGTAGNITMLTRTGGYVLHQSGSFATQGDAQTNQYVLRTETTDGTANVEMFLDGTGGTRRMLISSGATWHFEVHVVARRTDANNESAGYRYVGVIDNNAGTTALVGSVTEYVDSEDTPAWTVLVDADNTSDALRIRVTGETSKTIRWVAFVRTVEVTI